MRLNQFRQLSPKQQKKETQKAIAGIKKAGQWLNKNGVWTVPTEKQLKEAGEPLTLWRRIKTLKELK